MFDLAGITVFHYCTARAALCWFCVPAGRMCFQSTEPWRISSDPAGSDLSTTSGSVGGNWPMSTDLALGFIDIAAGNCLSGFLRTEGGGYG